MENCCCRGCEFNLGTSVRGDRTYSVTPEGEMPYSQKFDGPGEDTVKYGEK
jgi:hypothetical protein